jgi:hypothetical protein
MFIFIKYNHSFSKKKSTTQESSGILLHSEPSQTEGNKSNTNYNFQSMLWNTFICKYCLAFMCQLNYANYVQYSKSANRKCVRCASLILSAEHRLRLSESRVLRRILGSKTNNKWLEKNSVMTRFLIYTPHQIL